jgi:uncharacterized protein YjeT (DUF2065 family)
MPIASYVLFIIGLFYLAKPSASIKSAQKKKSFPRKILSEKQYLFYRRLTGTMVIILGLLVATILRK